MIRIKPQYPCPRCSSPFNPYEKAGRGIRCQGCGSRIDVVTYDRDSSVVVVMDHNKEGDQDVASRV